MAEIKGAGRKVNLTEGIMFRGKVYGPGKGVAVPSDFPDPKQLAEKRKISSARNAAPPMEVSTGGKEEQPTAAATAEPTGKFATVTPDGGTGEGDTE